MLVYRRIAHRTSEILKAGGRTALAGVIRRDPSGMLTAKHRQPDLVILDLDFRSAISVLESIDPCVPVVVFTSLPTTAGRRLALELGALDYIEKPTNPTEFVEAVSDTVRQWAAEPVHESVTAS